MQILIADDHSLVRDGVSSILEAAGHTVVGQAQNGQEAIEATLELEPDLVLMDISMPGVNGLEALKSIKEKRPAVRVVMLTVSNDDSDLIESMRAGASGYLPKNLDSGGFIEILKKLEDGEYAVSPDDTARLIEGLIHISKDPLEGVDALTQREIEILSLVADGFSNREIAEKLMVSDNTIKYHMKKVLRKMGVHNRTEAVSSAIRSGIIDKEHSKS